MSWLEKASLMISEEMKATRETVADVSENTDPEKAGEIAEKSLNESEKNETDNSEEISTDKGEKNNGIQNKEESGNE